MSAMNHYEDIRAIAEPLGITTQAELIGENIVLLAGGVEIFEGTGDEARAFLQDRIDKATEYDERVESKRDRLQARADKKSLQAAAQYQRSNDLIEHIPFGQPILVGHHSEARHRKTLERSRNAMFKSCDLSKEAAQLQARADSAGNTGIQSDDKNADIKLLNKIAELEQLRDGMKAANKIIRQHKITSDSSDKQKQATIDALIAARIGGVGKHVAAELVVPDYCGRIGFPSYALTNLGANIRRLKSRIAEVEHVQAVAISDDFGNGITASISDDQKIVIEFPGKPDDDTRTALKRSAFKWSRMRGAWVRKLTANAEAAYNREIRPMLCNLVEQESARNWI